MHSSTPKICRRITPEDYYESYMVSEGEKMDCVAENNKHGNMIKVQVK